MVFTVQGTNSSYNKSIWIYYYGNTVEIPIYRGISI